jgi:hypothetical protein
MHTHAHPLGLRVAELTGIRYILNFGMQHRDPKQAMELVAQFKLYIKEEHIFALQVGNEPDHLWKHGARPTTYSGPDFFAEYDVYVAAVRAIYPTLDLMGPSYAYGWRDAGFQIPFIEREAQSTKYISFHRYELRGCASTNSLASLLDGGCGWCCLFFSSGRKCGLGREAHSLPSSAPALTRIYTHTHTRSHTHSAH